MTAASRRWPSLGLSRITMSHGFSRTFRSRGFVAVRKILGRTARVTSQDPETRESVRLIVTPDRIESVVPDGAVVSFIQPDGEAFGTSAANIMENFCHFVFFFSSRTSGESWIARHPGTFLYTLEDAFALAKRLNALWAGVGAADTIASADNIRSLAQILGAHLVGRMPTR